MPSITLASPPCIRQLSDNQPDTVVVFHAENGVSVSGAVFLSHPPSLTASVDKSRPATLPPPSAGGSIHLEPFLPFDMLQPQSIYNPKGAGAPSLLPTSQNKCTFALASRPLAAHAVPARLVAERVASSLVRPLPFNSRPKSRYELFRRLIPQLAAWLQQVMRCPLFYSRISLIPAQALLGGPLLPSQ
jgi:hypothetical protein